jgi:hypothetical protein
MFLAVQGESLLGLTVKEAVGIIRALPKGELAMVVATGLRNPKATSQTAATASATSAARMTARAREVVDDEGGDLPGTPIINVPPPPSISPPGEEDDAESDATAVTPGSTPPPPPPETLPEEPLRTARRGERKQLPEPPTRAAEPSEVSTVSPPSSDAQMRLAQLWAQLSGGRLTLALPAGDGYGAGLAGGIDAPTSPQPVCIKRVREGSPFALAGGRSGDLVVSVNGADVRLAPLGTVQATIVNTASSGRATLDVTLLRPDDTSRATLQKIVGVPPFTATAYVAVVEVEADVPAQNVEVEKQKATEELASSTPNVTVVNSGDDDESGAESVGDGLVLPPIAQEDPRRLYSVTLEKGLRGLGLSLAGRTQADGRTLVVVQRIVHGGPADRHGGIEVGDALVACNGLSLYGHSRDAVLKTLSSSSGIVELTLVHMSPGDAMDQEANVDAAAPSAGPTAGETKAETLEDGKAEEHIESLYTNAGDDTDSEASFDIDAAMAINPDATDPGDAAVVEPDGGEDGAEEAPVDSDAELDVDAEVDMDHPDNAATEPDEAVLKGGAHMHGAGVDDDGDDEIDPDDDDIDPDADDIDPDGMAPNDDAEPAAEDNLSVVAVDNVHDPNNLSGSFDGHLGEASGHPSDGAYASDSDEDFEEVDVDDLLNLEDESGVSAALRQHQQLTFVESEEEDELPPLPPAALHGSRGQNDNDPMGLLAHLSSSIEQDSAAEAYYNTAKAGAVERLPAQHYEDAHRQKWNKLREAIQAAILARVPQSEFDQLAREDYNHLPTTGKLKANKLKNRYGNILPNEACRVQLGEDGGYINATLARLPIAAGAGKDVIMSQGPTEATTPDFWQMVFDQRSPTIVMLTDTVEGGRVKCHAYWPPKKRKKYSFGDFDVENLATRHSQETTVSFLKMTKKSTGEVGGKRGERWALTLGLWPCRQGGTWLKSYHPLTFLYIYFWPFSPWSLLQEHQVTHIKFAAWPDHGTPEIDALIDLLAEWYIFQVRG